MIKVYQSIVDKGDGDCFRAAIASVLDLTLEQVPHFLRFKSDWNIYFFRFMKMMDYEHEGNCSIKADRGLRLEDSFNGYFICTVPSATFKNVFHSVVIDINGNIIHDPNPNKLWLGKSIYDIEDASHICWYMVSKYKRPKNELW